MSERKRFTKFLLAIRVKPAAIERVRRLEVTSSGASSAWRVLEEGTRVEQFVK